MRTEIRIAWALLVLSWVFHGDAHAREFRFPAYTHGQLVVEVPESWSGELIEHNPRLASMQFTDGGTEDFAMVLTAVMPAFGRDSELSPAAVRRTVLEIADENLMEIGALEGSEGPVPRIVVEDYRSPGIYGSYFSFSNPKAAKGRSFSTQGALAMGDVAVSILAHGYSDPDGIQAAALSVIRSLKLVPMAGTIREGK